MKKTIFTDFDMFLRLCKQLSKKVVDRLNPTSKLIKIEENAMVYSDRFILFKIHFQNLPYKPGVYWIKDFSLSEERYPDYTKPFPDSCENRFKFHCIDEYDYMEFAKLDLPIPFKYWTIFQKHLTGENWFAHFNEKNKPIIISQEIEYYKEKILEEDFILVMPCFVELRREKV